MEKQGQKSHRFDPMIPAADMDLLMAEDIPPLLFSQMEGQIDPGAKKAQDKSGGDPVTGKDVFFFPYSLA